MSLPSPLTQEDNNATLGLYFKGVAQELGRITWPTFLQLLGQLLIVVLVVTFTTLLVWSMDLSFRYLLHVAVPRLATPV
jgi:preprotein translocase SecE subunit